MEPLGCSPCPSAAGAWRALPVKVPHSAGSKQVLAKALWRWLTDRAWTVWKCHLKIIHFISVIGENYQDGAHPGREADLPSCLCGCRGKSGPEHPVPAHLWLQAGERAQHSSVSLDLYLSCSTDEMGKGIM